MYSIDGRTSQTAQLGESRSAFHAEGLTWITPSESQNTLAMILPADSCVLNFLDGGDPLWCHFMLDCFDSEVKQWIHIFTLGLCFLPIQTGTDVWQTHWAFWSNVNIFGTHQAHTFLNNKCSTLTPLLHAISHSIICLFPNIRFLIWWMFTTCTAVGWMQAFSRFETT
jgi:hypothetical protein